MFSKGDAAKADPNPVMWLSHTDNPTRLSMAVGGCFVVSIGHLALGTDFGLVVLSFFVMAVTFVPPAFLGMRHLGALLVFLALLRHTPIVVIVKVVTGQPLQDNLSAPDAAYAAMLLGAIGYVSALFVAHSIPVGKPILRQTTDPRFLGFVAVVSATIGGWGWIARGFRISASVSGADQLGTSYSAFIAPFFLLAIVAATARIIAASDGKRSIDRWVVALVLVQVFAGVVANSKLAILVGFIAYFTTVFFFNYRVPRGKVVLMLILAGLISQSSFTALIHDVRRDRGSLTALQRAQVTLDTVERAITDGEFRAQLRNAARDSGSTGSYLRYFGKDNQMAARAALIQNVDSIIPGINIEGPLGTRYLLRAFEQTLPRLVHPNKPLIGSTDILTWHVGLRPYGAIGFPTVPLIGDSYAVARWIGVIAIPFLAVLSLMLALKKLGWSLHQNIWAIYFLVKYHNTFAEGAISSLLIMLLRKIPQDALFILALTLLWGLLDRNKFPTVARYFRLRFRTFRR